MTTDAAVGKKVGRVGKDGVEEFKGVAVIKPEAAGVVAVGEAGERGCVRRISRSVSGLASGLG